MSCTEQNHQRILGLLTGEIGPAKALFLRRHIGRCSQCRAHLEQMQELWSGLSCSASVAVSPSLKQRIADSFPAPEQSVHRISTTEAFKMRKRLVIASVAVLLIAAAALVASQLTPRGGGDGTVGGRQWDYVTTFQGRVNFLNPDGSVSTAGEVTLPGNPDEGEVRLRVDGIDYAFEGVGKHEVRNPSGELLGYVNMEPAPSPEQMAAESSKALGRISGTEFGAEGFDKVLGISWEMRGTGKVKVSVPSSVEAGILGGSATTFRNTAVKVPELTVKTPSGVIRKQGYGTHEIPIAGGKATMTITIEPLSQPAP